MRTNKKKSASKVSEQINGVSNMAKWISEQVSSFGNMAKGFAKNPIGIIALFIVLVYSFAAMLTFSGALTQTERTPFIYFLIIFPFAVLGVFAWLVGKHSVRLFAPSDFQNEENFMKIASSLVAVTGNQQGVAETKAVAHQIEEAVAEQIVVEADQKELILTHPQTPSSWFDQMFTAFLSRNLKEAEQAFTRMQEAENDPTERLKNQALYLYLVYSMGGDSSALPKLLDLAERKETAYYIQPWIGRCYAKAGDFQRAAEAYEVAAHLSDTEEERADHVVAGAGYFFKAGNKDNAYSWLMSQLGVITSLDAASKLYEGLAALYHLDDNAEFRAIALEKALERRPNDTSLHFDAAYSYSEGKLEKLALLHYKIAINFDQGASMALNNIAIEYANLDMLIRAVNFHKRSSDLDETLSMANLAYRFMNAGFADEASAILDKARLQKNIHPNVGHAIASLAEKEEEEKKTEERILDSARKQQRFMNSFSEAYFTAQPNCPSFDGIWTLPSETEVKIAQTGAQIAAIGTNNNEEYKFKGYYQNRGAKIYVEQKTKRTTLASILAPPSLLNPEYDLSSNSGYAYLSSDGHQLFIMNLKDNTPTFETLSRVL